MKAASVEDLQVWQRAWPFVEAISAQTRRGPLSQDFRLRDQIDACADSLLANRSEGFAQGTDRAFARFLCIARGSCAEIGAHLMVAQLRCHVTPQVADGLRKDAEQIARMLTGLINYLLRSDRKHRG